MQVEKNTKEISERTVCMVKEISYLLPNTTPYSNHVKTSHNIINHCLLFQSSVYFLPALTAALVTLPPALSDLVTALMTPTATV